MMRSSACLALWGFVSLTACACDGSKPSSSTPPDGVQQAFESLSPEVLPAPPPDKSNRWADDPAAASFGQTIFFDPGFAGALRPLGGSGGHFGAPPFY